MAPEIIFFLVSDKTVASFFVQSIFTRALMSSLGLLTMFSYDCSWLKEN